MVQEIIGFAKRMGYKKLGIASCVGLIRETRILTTPTAPSCCQVSVSNAKIITYCLMLFYRNSSACNYALAAQLAANELEQSEIRKAEMLHSIFFSKRFVLKKTGGGGGIMIKSILYVILW